MMSSSSTTLRRRTCRVVVGVLAWAQLAVAAYACPLLTPGGARPDHAAEAACDGMAAGAMPHHPAAAEPAAAVPPASELDDTGALCLEHCRYGQQTNASTASSVVHPACLVALYPLDLQPSPAATVSSARHARRPEATAAPPPVALLHCCLRI